MTTKNPQIELLESRITPASVFTFIDVDGDEVKVTASKGDLQDRVILQEQGVGNQLLMLDLRDESFSKANVTISVSRAVGGDGFANVGFINAADIDLGKVKVAGDLGRIVAGDANEATAAVKLLKVNSMGQYGLSTQGGEAPTGGEGLPPLAGDLLTDLLGTDGVTDGLLSDVRRAVSTALSSVEEGESSALYRLLTNLDSNLGALLESGGLWYDLPDGGRGLLGNVAYLVSDLLEANGEGEGQGLLGSNLESLLTEADSKLDTLLDTLSPNLSLEVADLADLDLGLTEGGLLGLNIGNLLGLGEINVLELDLDALLALDRATLLEQGLGSVLGLNLNNLLGLNIDQLLEVDLGDGATVGGLLQTIDTALSSLLGGDNFEGLPPQLQGLFTRLDQLLGPVLAGEQPLTSDIANLLTRVQTEIAGLLGLADVPDALSQEVQSVLRPLNGTITNVLDGVFGDGTAGGDGGEGDGDALSLTSTIRGDIGRIEVKGNVRDAFLNIQGDVKTITIRGGLIGDEMNNGGQILVAGDLGLLDIRRGVVGGLGVNSGAIVVNGTTDRITILGSLVGSAGANSGSITLGGDVKSLTIRGDIVGGDGALSGKVQNDDGGIGKLDIRKSLIAGGGEESGTVRVSNEVKKVLVGGSIVGDTEHRATLSAAGLEEKSGSKNEAFKKIQIRGSVLYGDILAGYNTDLQAVNGDAQINSILVKRNWTASNLSAGIESTSGPDRFGDPTSRVIDAGNTSGIVASIAKIQIKGSVAGTAAEGDQYAFAAEQIGSMKINKTKVPLTSNPSDSIPLSNTTGDVVVREVSNAVL